MVLVRSVVISCAVIAFCYFKDVNAGQRGNRNADNLQKVFEILAAQDQKLNRLHTLAVTNQFHEKCTSQIKFGSTDASSKCWTKMKNEIKLYDQSTETEAKLLGQLITDAYDGDSSQLLKIAKFIKYNVANGSELAFNSYSTLLDEMDNYGQLYLKGYEDDNGLGAGLRHFTHRVLFAIAGAEGVASPIFTRKLPSVVTTIITANEVFIQNAETRGFMYASSEDSKVLLNSINGNNSRYAWKLIPASHEWGETNRSRELFYIKNSLVNKILSVDDDADALVLAEETEEKLKSTWAMFYIRLVQGTTGQEVAIQCSYWGIKTLGVDKETAQLELLNLDSLKNAPEVIWLLQPKVEQKQE